MNKTTFEGDRLNVGAAANYTGLPKSTLASYRCEGRGPAYYRLGKHVFYRRSDLDVWLESNRVDPAA